MRHKLALMMVLMMLLYTNNSLYYGEVTYPEKGEYIITVISEEKIQVTERIEVKVYPLKIITDGAKVLIT